MERESDRDCSHCNKGFNSNERKQIILPCDHLVCTTCFEILFQPKQRLIVCPDCWEKLEITDKFYRQVHRLIRGEIASFNQTLNIICDKHPKKQVECYCQAEEIYMCMKCAYDNHQNHQQSVIEVNKSDIESFCKKTFEKLSHLKDRIDAICSDIAKFKLQKIALSSKQFTDLIKEVNEILGPRLSNPQEFRHSQQSKERPKSAKKASSAKNNRESNSTQASTLSLEFDKLAQQTFNMTYEHQQLLRQWVGGKDISFSLLYRSSRDGLTPIQFHKMCDNQGPTLSLIKSDAGNVFGGYSSIPWSTQGSSKPDETAFIFSLTHKAKHEQYQNYLKAVYHCQTEFCSFGNDLEIHQANSNSSCACFGNTYSLPKGMTYQSEEAKNYLAGSSSFKPTVIEVYKVIYGL